MLKLTKSAFDKAKEYIFANATPIEKAWFRYNFEGSDTNAFMEELAKYQFDNGGFGGLVYEFEYQGPCLKCTEHAFRYIYYLKDKPKAEHPVIQKMMRYVLEHYNPETGCWGELLEPEVNDGLHVWWWTYGEDEHQPINDFDERVKQYNPNGQAALAAFVALYSELVPEDLYKDIIRYPIEKILLYYDINSPLRLDSDTEYFTDITKSPYNMKCLQQFCDCLKDKKLATRLKNILRQDPTACMELDESVWGNGYHETPYDIVATPSSFLYTESRTEVDRSLDALIRRQSENGAWHLTYRFGDDEGFRKMEAMFEAHLTMLNLAILNRFGRIDILESRCGICCSKCKIIEDYGVDCVGCVNIQEPFWGVCSVKKCCEDKQLENCGQCNDFPCELLKSFAYDKDNGDNGERIEQCKRWCGLKI